jgi:uncharacterized protein (DUF1800 family)
MALISDRDRTAHLLRRFGLGASEAEIEYYGAGGWRSAVDRLLACESIDEPVIYTEEFLKDQDGRMPPNPIQTQTTIYSWLLTTNRPLQAKMTVFWHDHFATSSEKVSNGPAMYKHWNTLWEGALGKFENLLLSISKDPAMLYWLDNIENVKGRANENFAREVMELFTLGVDHYTEEDIQEAARAFTGWSFGFQFNANSRVLPNRGQVPRLNSVFVFDERNHDNEEKSFFGKKANWNGDGIIKELCGMPRTAYYLVEKLWEFFAYAKPERSLIEKHAAVFLKSGLDIKVALRGIMMDEEFYSSKAERTIVKNPIDFCIPTLRQLGVGASLAPAIKDYTHTSGITTRARLLVARETHKSTEAMGMALLLPPDVAGWPSQLQWVSTATMVERIKWSDKVFGGRGTSLVTVPVVAPFGTTSQDVVSKMLSVFDARLPQEKVDTLVAGADRILNGGRVSRTNGSQVAIEVAKLLFSTPEFQFM